MSIPHAGRIYPPEILAAARVSRADLARLEDGWCDLVAADACAAGATVVESLWARAVADCNRGEGQMAPGEVAMPIRSQFSAPGRKERAGLGVVPTRLADCGPLWKHPLDRSALDWRLDALHRPYHAALARELAAARERRGHAILVDLHSMPPIAAGHAGHGARIVVGDLFGGSSDDWLTSRVRHFAERLGVAVSLNQPYAGGHILRRHGRPAEAVHAVQIEIDRSLYLTPDRAPDPARLPQLVRWFGQLVAMLGSLRPVGESLPVAAE